MKLLHITVTDKGQGIDEFVSMAINTTRRVYRDMRIPGRYAMSMVNQNYYILQLETNEECRELETRLEATGIVDIKNSDQITMAYVPY